MDFGDILAEWERITAKPVGKKRIREDERSQEGQEAASDGIAEDDDDPCEGNGPARAVDPLTAWLRTNDVFDKDSEESDIIVSAAARRRRIRAKEPDATIDLHGLTRDEAWLRLSAFFTKARRLGAEKVLIVHGKGNHSEGESTLKRTTREFAERCPFAGEIGQADTRSGGSGATWVILKRADA